MLRLEGLSWLKIGDGATTPNAMRRERGYATTVIERTPSGRLLFLASKHGATGPEK